MNPQPAMLPTPGGAVILIPCAPLGVNCAEAPGSLRVQECSEPGGASPKCGLRMTALQAFSAACKTTPFRTHGEQSALRNPHFRPVTFCSLLIWYFYLHI